MGEDSGSVDGFPSRALGPDQSQGLAARVRREVSKGFEGKDLEAAFRADYRAVYSWADLIDELSLEFPEPLEEPVADGEHHRRAFAFCS